MADIRQYRKEKENIAEDDYETRIRNHRIKLMRMFIVIAAVVIVAILIFSLSRHKTSYSSYKTETSMRRKDSGYSEYISMNDHIVHISRDGISYMTYGGSQVWNYTFEMNNMTVEHSGSYIAVADINGNEIHTYGESGHIADINTSLPILQMCVSKAGYVVVVVEDKNADYIHMYSVKGEKIYTIKKTIGIDGVPISVSVSEDGEKLIAAFTGIEGSLLKTSIVFYNFNEVGQNENERVVGGYDFGTTMVGRVEFINGVTAVAFAEDKICVYNIREYPKLTKEIKIDYEINHIFTSPNAFGVIHKDAESGANKLEIYDSSGELVYGCDIKDSYTNYKFSGANVLMYDDLNCKIITLKGKNVFSHTFENGISNIVPINGKDEFIFIDREYIKKIKLK